MELSAHSTQISAQKTHKNDQAFINCTTDGAGYFLSLWLAGGAFYLCTKENIKYLVGIPHEGWEQDLKDCGYEILYKVIK